MILLIVGNCQWDFNRLLKKIEKLSYSLDEEVIMQIGHSTFIPDNSKFFHFIKRSQMDELIDESRMIISHAGVGTILQSVIHQKPIIIVPRRKKFNEHIDDHQFELSKELESKNKYCIIYDVEKLTLEMIKNVNFIVNSTIHNEIAHNIEKYIKSI